MKIKKKGNFFVAHRDATDTNLDPRIKVGDSLGKISIETGKFVGNTACLIALTEKHEEYVQKLVDEVTEQVKADMLHGDVTVLDEILKHVPIQVLIHSLPEERWKEFE